MTTKIHVQKSTYSNGSNFNSKFNHVDSGKKIELNAAGNDDIYVYTYQYDGSSWQLTDVFENGQAPYTATTGGTTYTLASGVSGSIQLSLSSSAPPTPNAMSGTNGTINVGGGSGGGSGGDDD